MESSGQSCWEDIFRSQGWGRYPSESVIRFVARRFYAAPDRRAVRLLDLGCGTGACAWYMAREGFQVSAIDSAPTGIATAEARFAEEGLAAEFRLGDIAELPWGDDTFDGVVDSFAMCCMPLARMRRVVGEVRRVLRPGGWFLSLGFSDRSWGYGLGRPLGDGAFTDITEGPFRDRGTTQLLSRAQAESLLTDFDDRSLESASWSHNGLRDVTEQWILQGRKPPRR
ncbi:MAG: class I SAM-dependent methyltransferase [Polyangiales bacterium]